MADFEFPEMLAPAAKRKTVIKRKPTFKNSMLLNSLNPASCSSFGKAEALKMKMKSKSSNKRMNYAKQMIKSHAISKSNMSKMASMEDDKSISESSFDRSFENFSKRSEKELKLKFNRDSQILEENIVSPLGKKPSTATLDFQF